MRARKYLPNEVKQILLQSQGSEPPAGTGWKKLGHSKVHVNPGKERLAEMAAEHLRRSPNSAKSSFLKFDDQVRVVTELLNSTEGQTKLMELDEKGRGSKVSIETDLTLPVTVHFNMTGMRDDTRKIPWHHFVVLVAATQTDIYIHTCYADVIVH